jgi:radical SAM protein with 4Fe4S-binding SPASM domain
MRYHLAKRWLNFEQLAVSFSTVGAFLKWKITGKFGAPSLPLILMVEPTNYCNFACPLCDKGSGKLNRVEGKMSFDSFRNILDDIGKGVEILYLWNQGEPLLNSELTEMIAYAKRKGIFTIISVNGSLLKKYAEELVASNLDELIVSLDGASPETFKLYRRGGDFSEIIEGVKRVVQVRGRKSIPLISLQFLLLKHNIREIASFRHLAKSAGVDRVLLKTAQVSSTEEAETFLPQDSKLTRYIDNTNLVLKRKHFNCRRLLYSAVIDWNGNVVPCCFDKNEDFVMGNIFQTSFSQIWKGEKFRRFRDLILKGERPAMCSNCTEGVEKLFI